jgi:ABC-type glycerol-3-phosphate transport system substrate-binding protein
MLQQTIVLRLGIGNTSVYVVHLLHVSPQGKIGGYMKAQGLFKAGIAVLLFFAVSTLPVFAKGDKEADSGVIKLTYWLDNSIENFESSVQVTDAWNREHPECQVELVPLPTQDAYNQKILTAAAGGALPDIMHIDELFVPQYATQGILADVTPFAKRGGTNPINFDDIYDNAVDMARIGDKIYGYPDDYTWAILAYRKDLFIAAGLDPNKPPKTWDEFVQYAQKLTIPEKNQYGFVIQPYDWWFISWLWMNGAELFSPDGKKAIMNSPEGVEALQFYVDLNSRYHVVPPAVVGAMRTQGTQFSAESAFMNGQVAMLQIGPWLTQNYYTQKPDDVSNLIYAPFPVNARKNISKATIGGRVVCISETSKYKEQAWAYAKYLCENKVEWYKNAASGPNINETLRDLNPAELLVRKSVRSLPFFQHPHMKPYVDTVQSATLRPRLNQWIMPARIINEELQAAILGIKTPKQAMDDMAGRINPLL